MSIDRLTKNAEAALAAVREANKSPLTVDDAAYCALLRLRREAYTALADAIAAADDRFMAKCRAIANEGAQNEN